MSANHESPWRGECDPELDLDHGRPNASGAGSSAGDSPIDAGSATRLEIRGLANGSLYYFTVVAYDSSQPRQQSAFSAEVSARPSRMYK